MVGFHDNDVLIRVFATRGNTFAVQEWWIECATEGRRITMESYDEAVMEAIRWEADLSGMGLMVVTDQHIKGRVMQGQKQPTQRQPTQKEIYDDLMGESTSYGVQVW